jgi:hypothetical protein
MEYNILPFTKAIILIVLWELVWKGLALWYSARNKHTAWYICILIFNTLGILPIIYMAIHVWKHKGK